MSTMLDLYGTRYQPRTQMEAKTLLPDMSSFLYKELTVVTQTGGTLESNPAKAMRNAGNKLVCKQRNNTAHVSYVRDISHINI